MNAIFIKTQFFHKTIYDLKRHFHVMVKFCDSFTSRPYDLINTTLTYVPVDNFVLVSFLFIVLNLYPLYFSFKQETNQPAVSTNPI